MSDKTQYLKTKGVATEAIHILQAELLANWDYVEVNEFGGRMVNSRLWYWWDERSDPGPFASVFNLRDVVNPSWGHCQARHLSVKNCCLSGCMRGATMHKDEAVNLSLQVGLSRCITLDSFGNSGICTSTS